MDSNAPAFPTPEIRDGNGNGIIEASYGLTVRQYAAIMALQGLMPSEARNDLSIPMLAELAIKLADALLAQLAKDKSHE